VPPRDRGAPPGPPTPPTTPLAAPRDPRAPPPGPVEYPVIDEPAVPWWQHEWAVAAVGLVALLVGVGIGLLIGSGGGATKTQTNVGEAPAGAVTHTVTRSSAPRTKVLVRTHTVTVTAPAATAPAGEAGTRGSYSGTGTRTVGTVEVPRDSTLRWTCEGACTRFSIFNSPEDENSISLSSGGHSGSTQPAAGTYHEVRVVTGGTWTLRIE